MSEYKEDLVTGDIGYISIKDYAYDESNPLHHGYFNQPGDSNTTDVKFMNLSNYTFNWSDKSTRIFNDSERRQSILLPNDQIINQKAVAMYDFLPENDNELELKEGDMVFIGYKHGQGWLVAENSKRTKTGLVPEEYVSFINEDLNDQPRPHYLSQMITQNIIDQNEGEWEDIDDEDYNEEEVDQMNMNLKDKLEIRD